MSNSKNSAFEPGIYVKGDQTRRVETAKDAVAASFDGFTRQPTEADVALPTAAVNDSDPQAVKTFDF